MRCARTVGCGVLTTRKGNRVARFYVAIDLVEFNQSRSAFEVVWIEHFRNRNLDKGGVSDIFIAVRIGEKTGFSKDMPAFNAGTEFRHIEIF